MPYPSSTPLAARQYPQVRGDEQQREGIGSPLPTARCVARGIPADRRSQDDRTIAKVMRSSFAWLGWQWERGSWCLALAAPTALTVCLGPQLVQLVQLERLP